ncbi:hypothetical protein [Pseudoalteromonas rhizosphaerae]|uniref:hypothetical protein n=1 Tax=Pseudoalteromonas rhizosphaerae TaxID=2518973 RepID=UPI0012303BF5|nr:hypothetical protein [Pseudoalteromonas rhizosphaerae]
MNISLLGASKVLGLLIISVILIGVLMLYFTSINETVESGSSYELTIGSSKKDVFNQLPKVLKAIGAINVENEVNIELYISGKKVPEKISKNLTDLKMLSFEKSNKWRFYIDSKYFFNNLTIEFCGEKLCKVKRYRRYLELP